MAARPAAARPRRRRAGFVALCAAVLLAHGLLTARWAGAVIADGAADTARPAPIAVRFVQTLAPSEPPAVPPPRRATAAAAARPAAAAASSPRADAEPARPVETAAAAPAAVDAPPADPGREAIVQPAPAAAAGTAPDPAAAAEPAPDSAAVAEAAGSPAAAASAPLPAFEWPPSTRLAYALTGHFRGPVEGRAQVEWRRDGARYQVRMDLEIGAPFAVLARRSVASDGLITADGLAPRRYDEETRVALGDPRRLTVWLAPERIVTANGREWPRPAGVQDSASQFVHLTWLFTTDPSRLEPGRSIELPLALPRSVEPWTYDVVAREPLDTPFGTLQTVHVKPRRAPRPGAVLTAEVWIAPSLQYLPARIVVRQDEQTWLDLRISELPLQAAGGR